MHLQFFVSIIHIGKYKMHLHICRCILIFYFLLIMAKSFAFNILSLFKSSKAEIVLSFLFLFISSKSHSDFTKHRLSVSSLSATDCGSSILTYLLTHSAKELENELFSRGIKLNQHQQMLVNNYLEDCDFYIIE